MVYSAHMNSFKSFPLTFVGNGGGGRRGYWVIKRKTRDNNKMQWFLISLYEKCKIQ